MSPETLSRAIEPFYSTKELGRGTGLGLSMVHGLAGQLGGGFSISSEQGRGTRVDIFLPIASEDVADTAPSSEVALKRTSKPLSLLLVDDEDLVRFATAEMLRDLGHSVTEAASGPDALVELDKHDAFDAVVTDYKMPRMDGAELARQIRQVRRTMPVLVITGYTGIRDDALGLPRLSKPFGQNEIAQALESLTRADAPVVRLVSGNG
jgi:CheY-like chemotaxis protein